MVSLSDVRRKNKEAGRHFFDRGLTPVVSGRNLINGKYIVTGTPSAGYCIYRYDADTGKIIFADNPRGSYSWEHYPTKAIAIKTAKSML